MIHFSHAPKAGVLFIDTRKWIISIHYRHPFTDFFWGRSRVAERTWFFGPLTFYRLPNAD